MIIIGNKNQAPQIEDNRVVAVVVNIKNP